MSVSFQYFFKSPASAALGALGRNSVQISRSPPPPQPRRLSPLGSSRFLYILPEVSLTVFSPLYTNVTSLWNVLLLAFLKNLVMQLGELPLWLGGLRTRLRQVGSLWRHGFDPWPGAVG